MQVNKIVVWEQKYAYYFLNHQKVKYYQDN